MKRFIFKINRRSEGVIYLLGFSAKNHIAAILYFNTYEHCSSLRQMVLCTAHLTVPEILIGAVLSNHFWEPFLIPPILTTCEILTMSVYRNHLHGLTGRCTKLTRSDSLIYSLTSFLAYVGLFLFYSVSHSHMLTYLFLHLLSHAVTAHLLRHKLT